MAQVGERDYDSEESTTAGNGRSFKFNAAAPEFVQRSYVQAAQPQVHVAAYFYPCFQYVDGTGIGSWIYVTDQETALALVEQPLQSTTTTAAVEPPVLLQDDHHEEKEEIKVSNELRKKIIKQAEYMFSDMSLLANETLAKHVSKDTEGFVPINFVTTTKKLKSINVSHQMVAQALRSSSNLVVSDDGKKVRRKSPFTEKEKEEIQLRTVIAENLPDDHSHQNIEKLFKVVGSIKAIRVCQPKEHNSRSSKGDSVFSNKLHALIEYENPETAEKAAEKLNDERNWRKGIRVRVMLKRSPKSVLKNRKMAFDRFLDDDEDLQEEISRSNSSGSGDSDENSSVLKRSWSRNSGKPKHRPRLQKARSLLTPASEMSVRQAAKGPGMPDGTRGFTMGRGKLLSVPVRSC